MKTIREKNKQARKDHIPTRLARLVRLRELNSPKWVIKTEQIALVLNAKGKKNGAIGKAFSKEQEELYARHVAPLLKGTDDDE